MNAKLSILPAFKRLALVDKDTTLSIHDKLKLTELINIELSGTLEGEFHSISSDVYHHPLCPGFSSSQIRKCAKTALHWLLDSNYSNEAMALGTQFHTLALEPHDFVNRYAVIQGYKKILGNGPEEVSLESYELMQEMLEALRSHKYGKIFFDRMAEAKIEKTYFAKDPVSGILLKVRADYLLPEILIDLKTTKDSSEQGFIKSIKDFQYFAQVAFYIDVLSLVGVIVKQNYLLAVETTRPCGVNAFSISQKFLDAGSKLNRQGIANLAAFLSGDHRKYRNESIVEVAPYED